ncbi:LOW QUALITY PROTEIN: hypothetical protein Cgig2_011403 [Carnegiea gigantea]|uniref:Uncharacterized protein n=1 Tax=Carnegiea gigantea TaxID=171969 RepID=A0A9Q1QNI0_9CARY|nr:LOW QUALITY PROTEIN: hypothetical protein Cgig2_011403 [Carnegiea gigantea]
MNLWASPLLIGPGDGSPSAKRHTIYNPSTTIPDLACIALQYTKAYHDCCDTASGPNAKRPGDSTFPDTFAPNCDVETSSMSQITGRVLGCQTEYILFYHERVFSEILTTNSKSLDILHSKNHIEVAGSRSGSDGPYFCVCSLAMASLTIALLSKEVLAKVMGPGCFGAANDDCNGANGRFLSSN